MIYQCKNTLSWIEDTVDMLLEYLKTLPPEYSAEINCAAGMTPSAPIHFGIFREIAVSSFIVWELKRRNKNAKLIYYWDDYDHFCKIPYFAGENDVEKYLGRKLGDVPDFYGDYNSYSEHIMHDFEKELETCGIFPEYNYQSDIYESGEYLKYIKLAVEKRKLIFDILNEDKKPYSPVLKEKRDKYFPLEIYCRDCGCDSVEVMHYDEAAEVISYECLKCGIKDSYKLDSDFKGKLVWKVNWAARWTDDKIGFESSGENQLTETGSYSASSKIVKQVFNGYAPFSLLYRFIGIPGVAKVSRALGEKTLASRLTDVLEPAIIRWLLLKNPPGKSFSIDIEDGIFRIYHEWDLFENKVKSGSASSMENKIYEIACDGVKNNAVIIPFKFITTALSFSGENKNLALKMLCRLCSMDINTEELYDKIKIRFDRAYNWLYKYNHINNELKLRSTYNESAASSFSEKCAMCIQCVVQKIDSIKTENEMSGLLYSVPSEFAKDKDEYNDLKKEFFGAIYQLLFGTNAGPKLSVIMILIEKKILKILLSGDQI